MGGLTTPYLLPTHLLTAIGTWFPCVNNMLSPLGFLGYRLKLTWPNQIDIFFLQLQSLCKPSWYQNKANIVTGHQKCKHQSRYNCIK